MYKVFIVQEDDRMRRVLNDTYDELFAALKLKNPTVESLIEDDDYCKLHDLLALLRLGHVDVSSGENEHGMYTMLEIREDRAFFSC